MSFSKSATTTPKAKKGKEDRHWINGGTAKDATLLDYSSSNGAPGSDESNITETEVSSTEWILNIPFLH